MLSGDMNAIEAYKPQLTELAERHGVLRLDVFGSAGGPNFNPATSDLDFLVTFEDEPPGGMADAYFDLLEALERLFNRPVDLVTERSISNPYFRRSVNESRRVVYVA